VPQPFAPYAKGAWHDVRLYLSGPELSLQRFCSRPTRESSPSDAIPAPTHPLLRLPYVNYCVIISRVLIAPRRGNDMAHHGVPSIAHTPTLVRPHPQNPHNRRLISNRNTPSFKIPANPMKINSKPKSNRNTNTIPPVPAHHGSHFTNRVPSVSVLAVRWTSTESCHRTRTVSRDTTHQSAITLPSDPPP
jgi:hypothetical protein